jgi:acetyltransferase-like isoleucine patch superfamily enzyme
VLTNYTIGNGAVISVGSIVTRDIPIYAVAVDNPGKLLKYRSI